MNAQDLKKLFTKRAEMTNNIRELTKKLRELDKRKQEYAKEVEKLDSIISKAGEEEPIVTEHAMLRFLELSGIISMDDITDTILTEDVKRKIRILKDCDIPIKIGDVVLRGVVRNNKMYTITPVGKKE